MFGYPSLTLEDRRSPNRNQLNGQLFRYMILPHFQFCENLAITHDNINRLRNRTIISLRVDLSELCSNKHFLSNTRIENLRRELTDRKRNPIHFPLSLFLPLRFAVAFQIESSNNDIVSFIRRDGQERRYGVIAVKRSGRGEGRERY